MVNPLTHSTAQASVAHTYDGNGNVIHATRTEKCTITLPSDIDDEVFESAMFYDCLNRLVVSASQGADGVLDADFHDAENQTLFTLSSDLGCFAPCSMES